MRVRSILAGAALAAAVALPGIASAATGYATGNVNLRAGPGTQYPVATTVRAGASVEVFGCLSNYAWCDIGYRGVRGWISGRYLEQAYDGRRVLVPTYARQIGVPVISFSFGNYWEDHYRGRSFYRDWDRYDDRRSDRRDIREERAEFQTERNRLNRKIDRAEMNDNETRVQKLKAQRRAARQEFRDDVEDITCDRGGLPCRRD